MDYNERIKLIQGLNDRLLYLIEKDRAELLHYLEALYSLYPVPREIRYGSDIIKTNNHGE